MKDGVSAEEVRAAYRNQVKTCHPDLFTNPDEQKEAQERLIRLNLAYEEALRYVSRQRPEVLSIPLEQALRFASRHMEQDNPQAALHQLARSQERNGEWYCLQGDAYSKLRNFDKAYNSYREATRLNPQNREYHKKALETELILQKGSGVFEEVLSFFKKLAKHTH